MENKIYEDNEEKIIKYFEGTLFFKNLNDDDIKFVINIIKHYKNQKREVLVLKIAQLIIKWERFDVFY